MDILIPDNWLRSFVKTKATPAQIYKYLSLCGPSVEKVERQAKNYIYHIEVTTNRVDSASVYGIAREAAAILPRFDIKAKLAPPRLKSKQIFTKKASYLDAKVDDKLCPRFTAVLIRNIKIKPSPKYIKDRLIAVDVRPINNIVDISNYIMHEIGQPTHTFDYDKIKKAKMVLRPSKPREKITTLDGKTHVLDGDDIVIEDGEGRLIDLAGIMGGLNSAVDKNTKNVLLFVQTYNPANIRRTYISLGHRTEAAALFEKDLDPELVTLGARRGIDLFAELAGGEPEEEILDIYPNPYKVKRIQTTKTFVDERLGASIAKSQISQILLSLGFETQWSGDTLAIDVPSFRANEVAIPEDIVEEVARIYGYHNLPSELVQGATPDPLTNAPFGFEMKVKRTLKGWGAVEVYTFSMVPKSFVDKKALKLKNPLGAESEYMRVSLMPSLTKAAHDNSGERQPFHLFEMANVYLPHKGDLPDEKMYLAGIFSNYQFREAKGIIEALLNELNAQATYESEDARHFLPNQRLTITSKEGKTGQFGTLEKEGYIYYEFELDRLRAVSSPVATYRPVPKYPAQIEDITLVLPERTRVGDLIQSIKSVSGLIKNIELTDIYKDSHTFRLWYQHPRKTLRDKEVEEIRDKVLKEVKKKFGAVLKD